MTTEVDLDAIIHIIGEEGDVVRSTRIHTMGEMDGAGPTKQEEGLGYQLMIENLRMKPVVDKIIALMKAQEMTFRSGKSFYAYIGGRPFRYGDNPPSAFLPTAITVPECRVAAQSHIHSLTGQELQDELSYIEGQYNKLINGDVAIGQTSIYEYMETDAV